MSNIYLELTRQFNRGRTRAILAGGQAVVLHRLAVMSKDGDWILREDQETTEHVRAILERYRARYRFGAPLDVRWMTGGWSGHLEFQWQEIRVRTDFVTRPPRLDQASVQRIWCNVEGQETPFLGATDLAAMKKTNREKDYAVIGELARRMPDLHSQILYSRSARDLLNLAEQHPDRVQGLMRERSVLTVISQGREALEAALDAERRHLIRANEERLAKYLEAAKPWAAAWPALSREIEGLALSEAHQLMVQRAETLLPFAVPGGWP